MIELPALVTLLTVLLLFGTMFVTGKARGKHDIKAPAISGHPEFERAYRVQMNTIENTVMFLPVLWLAATHGFGGLWAGTAGVIWLVGRAWYALAYLKDPAKRGGGFTVSMLGWAALVLMAGIGIVRAMMIG
jgi:glutathione S-transferase